MGNEEAYRGCKIDNRINTLDKKIYKMNLKNESYGYEKDRAWNYFVKVNWIKLDIPFKKPEDLIKALKTIEYIIKIYIESDHKWELYVDEWFMSWKSWVWPKIDIYVDNRIFLDTVFLTAETIQKVFWIDEGNKVETQKIADFLNKIILVTPQLIFGQLSE